MLHLYFQYLLTYQLTYSTSYYYFWESVSIENIIKAMTILPLPHQMHIYAIHVPRGSPEATRRVYYTSMYHGL